MTTVSVVRKIKHYLFLIVVGLNLFVLWLANTDFTSVNDVKAYPVATPVQNALVAYPSANEQFVSSQSPLPAILPNELVEALAFLPLVNQPQASPKKGLAWGHYVVNDEQQLNVRWYHNWDSLPYPNTMAGLEFVPYLWCDYTNGPNPLDLLQRATTQLGSNYGGYLLFLNEPDLGIPQCDMTIAEAAVFYLKTKHFLPQAKLIGPNMFTGNNDFLIQAIWWIEQWRQAIYDCSVNPNCNPYFNDPNVPKGYPQLAGYAIHPYSQTPLDNLNYVSQFYSTMQTIWSEGDKELWVTEFGYCLYYENSGGSVLDTVNGFESNSFVTRYAYFTTRTPGFEDIALHTPELQACDGIGDPWDTDLLDPTSNWQTLSRTGQAYRQVAIP